MKLVPFLSVLLSGLVAGLFYSYSCSVNPGLRALSDDEYLKAMQSINAAIQNPVFFASFMGLLLVYPVAAFQTYQSGPAAFTLLLTSLVMYYILVFGITVMANVPLNEQLAAFDINAASPEAIRIMRRQFEGPWNFYHAIRTYASVICFALTTVCFLIKNART